MSKTNAMRILDKALIKYETVTYVLDKEDFNAVNVSDILGLDYDSCFKTLALLHGHDLYICVIAANDQLDLKKCAREIGVKDLEMVHVLDLLKLVGYERGAVTPIGIKKNNGIYFDKKVMKSDVIELSAGQYGVGLKVKRVEILNFLKAEVKDLVVENC